MRCLLTIYMLLCEFNAESLSVCTLFNEYKSRTRLRNDDKELWECFFVLQSKKKGLHSKITSTVPRIT
jgi:hypothetical protein